MTDLQSRLREIPQVSALLEDDRVAPLLRGGETVEYATKMIPEDAYGTVGDLYADGVLLVVDQLEELFTLNPPAMQARFAELLTSYAG